MASVPRRCPALPVIALTATVAISAASIALGAISLSRVSCCRGRQSVLLLALIVACTAIAAYGVGESVRLAAAIGILEIAA